MAWRNASEARAEREFLGMSDVLDIPVENTWMAVEM